MFTMTEKMDPAEKVKWVEALRSGKYQQGRKKLRSQANTYCCLGVLCDIRDSSKWQTTLHMGVEGYSYEGSTSTCPTDWLPRFAAMNLINMNDGFTEHPSKGTPIEHEPLDFNAIADWIEKEL